MTCEENVVPKVITKAVFPAAGMGTRFLPATKASPKEMLPLVDKPLIQYVIEEAVASGIEEVVLVTGRNKRAIEDHFDVAFELEEDLRAKGKHELLSEKNCELEPEFIAGVVARALELEPVDGPPLHEVLQGVRELDLAPLARLRLPKRCEDVRCQDVPADDCEVRWCLLGRRFFHKVFHEIEPVLDLFCVNDAIVLRLGLRYFLDGKDRGRIPLINSHHLLDQRDY